MLIKIFTYLFFICSGFLAIAHELIWARLLKNFLVSNLLSSASVLAIFFGGMAIGTFIVNYFVKLFKKSNSAYLSLLIFGFLNLYAAFSSETLINFDNLFSFNTYKYFSWGYVSSFS